MLASCGGNHGVTVTDPITDDPVTTSPATTAPDVTEDPNNADFYIISAEDYRDKTTAGFLSINTSGTAI